MQLVKRSRLGLMVVAALLVVATVLGVASGPASAHDSDRSSVDYFLKLDGVEGESTDDKHKGEIEISSFSWGKSEAGVKVETLTQGGGGTSLSKATASDLSFKTHASKASPKLLTAAASGKHIKEATLTVRKSKKGSQHEYYKVTLTDVLVTSYRASGDGDVPTDEFSLNFAKISFAYVPTHSDGSAGTPVIGTWDLKLNKVD